MESWFNNMSNIELKYNTEENYNKWQNVEQNDYWNIILQNKLMAGFVDIVIDTFHKEELDLPKDVTSEDIIENIEKVRDRIFDEYYPFEYTYINGAIVDKIFEIDSITVSLDYLRFILVKTDKLCLQKYQFIDMLILERMRKKGLIWSGINVSISIPDYYKINYNIYEQISAYLSKRGY